METEFRLNTLIFTIHGNEFRSSKINRIVIDENGTNYIISIDGNPVEKDGHSIDKTKEGLFNKLQNKFTARRNK